ncbi:uncharacterized protein LOC106179815 [Lingula anatina]|uniref:Uncharacterized protein LOC106179815 n=1 Tax=Lingula anatina TaxID=7574 RepID=A0A1S3K961_LINAN|nr:uncharacterized protein LOC106179815 [Lingula anatina]|eukprot:XP_013419037.1 uncharacterized protein LOC106179815 [Lingula anatina]
MLLPQIDIGVRNTTSLSDLKRLRSFMNDYIVKERRRKQKLSKSDEHLPILSFDSTSSVRGDGMAVNLQGEATKSVYRSELKFEPILTSAGRKAKFGPAPGRPNNKKHGESVSNVNADTKGKMAPKDENSAKLNQNITDKDKPKPPKKKKEKEQNLHSEQEGKEKLTLGKSELIPEKKLLERRSSFIELFKQKPKNQHQTAKPPADYEPPQVHSSLDFPSPYVSQLGHPMHRHLRSQTQIAVRPSPEEEERMIDIQRRKIVRSRSVQAKRSAASALLARDKKTLQFKRAKAVYKVNVEEERALRQKTFYDSLEKLQLQHVMDHNKRIKDESRKRDEALNKRHRELTELHDRFERERTQRWNSQYVSSKRFNTDIKIVAKKEKSDHAKPRKQKKNSYLHFSKSKVHAQNVERYSSLFSSGTSGHPRWGPVASPALQVALMGMT